MKVTIGNVKNEKQAKRAIRALESAFNIVRPAGKEIIVKEVDNGYKAKYEKLVNEQNEKIADRDNLIREQNKKIDFLYIQLDAKESIEKKVNELNNELSESHREYKELLDSYNKLQNKIVELEEDNNSLKEENTRLKRECKDIKPYDLNNIKVSPCPIETCNTVEKAILTSGWTEPEPLPAPNVDREFSNETTPKMDGSLNRAVRDELDKWSELLDNDILEDELKKDIETIKTPKVITDKPIEPNPETDTKVNDGLNTHLEDLSERVQIPAEPDYIPPKIDLSVIAIPQVVFIKNKTKSINNWETKNTKIIDVISSFKPIEEGNDVTNKQYKSMYSKVSKFLNRDTLKAIRRKVFASDNNTVKKLYKKCYLELLTKIYDIITTDRIPLDSDSDDIEPKTNDSNINATLEDKSPQNELMNEIEDIKASLSIKVDKAVAKVDNKDIKLTNGTEVKQWAINEIKKVKANNNIASCSDIPYPYKRTHELLKRLRKFMSNEEVLHLLNILIEDDVFRGKTYERYIPNIKYWCVVRKLNKALKDTP